MDGIVEVDSGDISAVIVEEEEVVVDGNDDGNDDEEGPVEIEKGGEKGGELRNEVREEEEGVGSVGKLVIAGEGEDKGDVEGDVITE